MVGRHVRTRNGLWAALPAINAPAPKRRRPASWHGTGWTTPALRSSPTTAPATCLTATSGGWRLPVRWRPIRALLALDEPAAGMNAAEKMALGELLLRIRDDGKTLLMIEHDVKLVMGSAIA